MTAATSTETITDRDMAGFLLAHAAMRQEFALLAPVARAPRDDEHAALIEDQIELVCDTLHKHHNGEDSAIFAMLRERAPQLGPDIDVLEAEHTNVDPLLTAAMDTTVPLSQRADQ